MSKAVIPGFSAHEQITMIAANPGMEIEFTSDPERINDKMASIWNIHFYRGKTRYWFAIGIAKDGKPCSTKLWLSRPGDGDKLRHTSSMRAQEFMDRIWHRMKAAA